MDINFKKILSYLNFLVLFQIILIVIYFYASQENKSSYNIISTNAISLTNNLNNEHYFENLSQIIRTIKNEPPLRNQIWEQLNQNVFFKRSSAFFIIERLLLRVFLVCSPQPDYEYNAHLRIELDHGEIHHIHLKNGTKRQHAAFGNYVWKSLDFKINLLDYIKLNDYDEILQATKSFHLYLSDSNRSETVHFIDVKMKYIRSRPNKSQKAHSVVCSKCFWYKPRDYKDFFWWIELHKQAGYEKIFFCNNSIPDTREFREIFEKNKHFIQLSQLNYLPNLMASNSNRSSKSHNYLNYYHELGAYYHVDSDLFNMMMTNECFLNNTHTYSHVMVVDNDEIILPRVNSRIMRTRDNFKFISSLNVSSVLRDDLKHLVLSCSNDTENKFDIYLKNLTSDQKPVTFHFHMGFYLRDKQIKQIVETFESYFSSISFDFEKVHKIFVIDRLSASFDHNVYNFTFVLNSKEEIYYAMNLCRLYRFIERIDLTNIVNYSDRFHRFFYIGGLLSSFACGKSAHSTDVTFEFSVHYPEQDKMYPNQAELFSIGYDGGQLSHFRSINEFHKSSKKEVSIIELIFDLNYFNCFYMSIVEDFFKIKAF